MPLVGYLLGRGWDGRWMLAFGFAVAGLAFFGFSHMTLQSGTWDIFGYQMNQGIGMAFIFVPLTTLTMGPISREETGYATSLYSVTRNIGSSMGISFVTTLVTRRSQFHQNILVSHITSTNALSREMVAGIADYIARSGFDRVTAMHKAYALMYVMVQQQAALLSYVDAFHIMGILFLVITPLIFLMKRSDAHNGVR
jgi:DHA2 family multidrug resistance protein